jgi:hypothetical protein
MMDTQEEVLDSPTASAPYRAKPSQGRRLAADEDAASPLRQARDIRSSVTSSPKLAAPSSALTGRSRLVASCDIVMAKRASSSVHPRLPAISLTVG